MTNHQQATLANISTLTSLVDWRAETEPDRVIFHYHTNLDDYQAMSYSQLQKRAQQLARVMLSKLQPGDRVLIVLPPGLDYIVSFFACLYAGMIAVPIYPPIDQTFAKKMQYVINECKPKLLLTNKSSQHQFSLIRCLHKIPGAIYFLKKMAEKRPQLMLDMGHIPFLAVEQVTHEKVIPLPAVNAIDLAFLQYSSGSTGDPKGVMLTHENLVENLKVIHADLEFHERGVGVFWLPPYHDFGLIGAILETIYAGHFTALLSPHNFIKHPKLWFQLITRYKGTIAGGPNFCFDYSTHALKDHDLKDIDLSSLKFLFNAAEPVKARTLDLFTAKFAQCGFKYEVFFPAYGLAEDTLYITGHHVSRGKTDITVDKVAYAQGQITVLPEDENNSNAIRLVASGTLKNGLTIYNFETKTFANEGEVAEIIVHNKCIAKGYWGKSELTQEIFDSINIDGKKYLRTGDLGFVYNNMLFVSVRAKDLINIQGKQYYPHELEDLAEQTSSVLRPGGCVMLEDPNNPDHILLIAEIKEMHAADFSDFPKLVEKFSVVYNLRLSTLILIPPRNLPKTTSGKMRRFLCKSMYINHEFTLLNKFNHDDT
jgi:acyl-CoA synthetase (AMP-forming)/AMP-acid ligase II